MANVAGVKIELADPSSDTVAFLEERLYEFNSGATGIDDGEGLGVFAHSDDGELLAAIAGHTWGETCEIRQLWVRDSHRRRGLGSRLMGAAEAEAQRRGCKQLLLSTHSFQAPDFYAKLGYTQVCELEDYPRGHSQIFLRKTF